MFKIIGGMAVYGFALFGLVKFLQRIRFKAPENTPTHDD